MNKLNVAYLPVSGNSETSNATTSGNTTSITSNTNYATDSIHDVGVTGCDDSVVHYQFGPFSEFALARDKVPFQRGWRENLLSGEAIAHHLNRSSYANGVIGIIPGGYVVLDFDGPKAMQCLLGSQKLSRLEPSTVWFSGDPKREGLPKILYRLPEGVELPGKKLVQKFADGNAVEILLPGHQVTLPGSFHSEERGWYQERGDYPVADAPEWLLNLIETKATERRERFNTDNLRNVSEGDRSVEKLLLSLDADDYDTWVEVGLSLKAMGDEYLDQFDGWSSTGRKYKGFTEVEKKWSSFNPTKITNGYAHLCRLAGIKPPTAIAHQPTPTKYQSKLDAVAAIVGADSGTNEAIAHAISQNYVVSGDRTPTHCDPITPDFSRRELHILDAPKGNRKTSVAIRHAVDIAKQNDKTVYVVTPTRILSVSAAGVLDLTSHVDNAFWNSSQWHVTCPESIWRWSGLEPPDVVIFDECDEVLQRLLSAELVKKSKQLTTKEQLQLALLRCNTLILSQDKVSRAAVTTAQQLGRFGQDQTHYHLYSMPVEDRGAIAIKLYSDWIDPTSEESSPRSSGYKAWLNSLDADIQAGKKIIIPMGNRKKGRALFRELCRRYPDRKGMIFDGVHTFQAIKKQFADDPTQSILDKKPDFFIYTQVFNSGVSIECDWFDVSYELSASLETAWSFSQRGERNRTSIFGGKLQERHVYLTNQGALLPDNIASLKVEAIAQQLHDEAMDKWADATISGDAMDRAMALMPLLDYQARNDQLNLLGRYFKRELLLNEWTNDRSWSVEEIPGATDSPLFQALRDQQEQINIQTASIRASAGRTATGINLDRLGTANTEDQERSPLARVRAEKRSQVDVLGLGFALLNDEDWQLAWVDANGSPTTIRKLQIRALVQLDSEQPGVLDQLAQVTANAIVSCSGAILPIKNELIQTAKLMRSCPAVVAAIQETLPDRWSRFDDVAIATKQWAFVHADELATQSRRTSRNGTAFHFTEHTYELPAVEKCLAMVGIEDTSAGIEGKKNIRYRKLKTVEDALKSLQKAIDQGKDKLSIQTHQATVTRLETLDQTYCAVMARMRDRVAVGIGHTHAIELSMDISTTKVRSPHYRTTTPALCDMDGGVIFGDFGTEGGGLGGRIVS